MTICRSLLAIVVASVSFSVSQATAQQPIAVPLDQGFKVRVPAFPSGEERTRQPDLWMLDVDLKPMRMRYLNLTDPVTGEVSRQQVWYLVYRVFNRPIRAAEEEGSLTPENILDTPYTRPLFQPETTLITYDDPAGEIPLQTIPGDVSPEAVELLRSIEQRREGTKIDGDVEAIQGLPEATADSKPIYGLAIYKNVDAETDFFKVIFRGLTNAYDVRDDGDGKRIWRKVLVQKFRRPGDRYDPNQTEFDFGGNPEWIYVPAEPITDPDIIAASEENAAVASE